MNIKVISYLRFSGEVEELRPLIEKIGESLIEQGYGCDEQADVLNSLIVVEHTDIGAYENPQDFVSNVIETAMIIVIPTKEKEEHGSASH